VKHRGVKKERPQFDVEKHR